ncbi:MAG: metallophosphoesterase [Oligosphaeraceae bacterium]
MTVIALLLFLTLCCTVLLPLPVPWWGKALLAALCLAVSFKFPLFRWLGGPMPFAPRLPPWLILLAGWLFATALFLAMGGLLLSPLQLLFPKARGLLSLGLLTASLLATTLGAFWGQRAPRIREFTLAFPRLPEEAEGMTIALLTDLHADGVTAAREVSRMVELANARKPDLILLGGDLVDGTVEERSGDLAPLARLQAPLGVWAVPGNHEYYSGFAAWREVLPQWGVKWLVNEHQELLPGLALAGVADPRAMRHGENPPDLEAALEGLPPETFVLLGAHNPNLALEAAEHGVPLVLSGHTHGGMVWGLDWLVARRNNGFLSGLYSLPPQTKLLVSNGAGIWNGFPLRLGHPAEILLITLKRTGE